MTQEPATQAGPEIGEPMDESIWRDVVGRCPNCGTIINGRLAIEEEAAKDARQVLRDLLLVVDAHLAAAYVVESERRAIAAARLISEESPDPTPRSET